MKKFIVGLVLLAVLLFGAAVGGHFLYRYAKNDVKQEVTDLIENRD